MCDIVSALSAVSTAVSAFGAIQQAGAQAAAAEYRAKIDDQNAELAQRRAQDALERGQLEEEQKKREGTMIRKAQESSFAAANIDTGYGSPLDIITSTQTAVDMDAAIIRANAEREVEDFETQGVNFQNQSTLNRAEARNARSAGLFNAAGIALSGGAGIFRYRAGLQAVG
jgi:hypothetical protein